MENHKNWGLRTKGCTLIHEAVCLECYATIIPKDPTDPIIIYDSYLGRGLTEQEEKEFIQNDGFPDEETFFNYFTEGTYIWHKWRLKTEPLVIEKDGLVTMMFD